MYFFIPFPIWDVIFKIIRNMDQVGCFSSFSNICNDLSFKIKY